MKKRHFIILNIYLFIESLLWTLIDITRASRMKYVTKIHKKYNVPSLKDE